MSLYKIVNKNKLHIERIIYNYYNEFLVNHFSIINLKENIWRIYVVNCDIDENIL